MLEAREHKGGWLTLVSPKLAAIGVPHGFTTAVGGGERRWGVKSAGDLAGVLAAEGLADRSVVMGRQVHGCAVSTAASRKASGCDGFDAHATDDAGELVAVRTADCVPVLLASRCGKFVAAVHAGWRGLAAGVVEAACGAVRESRERGLADGLVAAVGPCIGFAAYEVGEEVAAQLPEAVVRRQAWTRPHLDLKAEALRRLLLLGVPSDQIDVSTSCTFSDADRFGSYRRDGSGCGHQAAYVGPAVSG